MALQGPTRARWKQRKATFNIKSKDFDKKLDVGPTLDKLHAAYAAGDFAKCVRCLTALKTATKDYEKQLTVMAAGDADGDYGKMATWIKGVVLNLKTDLHHCEALAAGVRAAAPEAQRLYSEILKTISAISYEEMHPGAPTDITNELRQKIKALAKGLTKVQRGLEPYTVNNPRSAEFLGLFNGVGQIGNAVVETTTGRKSPAEVLRSFENSNWERTLDLVRNLA